MLLKPIKWVGASRSILKQFPDEARYKAGSELFRLQEGKTPTDWKPMSIVGAGAKEIRIHVPNEYRVIYVAKFEEAIYVLHCFKKTTHKTSHHDIEIARSAYAEAQRSHKTQKKI
ncbi:MAG: type II toxin-antitoxin system RelE/ParE family toxin [Candidatus Obscuribacterales bacterium]|nr:type II toxin-antitoxin system RelE/ParE family toxin [Candidatus Obscuribacterales bacterium]